MTIHFYSIIFFIMFCTYAYAKKFLNNTDTKKISKYLAVILIIISSFRWNVGGDWDAYYVISQDATFENLNFGWSFVYRFINTLSGKLFLGIYGVNLIVSILFFYSLYKLSKTLNFDFFLLMILSYSLVYFTGVMGYVRQTFALSFLILFVNYLIEGKNIFSIIYFFISVATHSSVLIFTPVLLYVFRKSKFNIFLCITLILTFLFANFPSINNNFYQFLNVEIMSAGIKLRLIPIFLCSIIFIFSFKKIFTKSEELNFFISYNFFLIILLNSLFIFMPFLSSIIDRLNFFFYIFQILIIGRFFLVIIKPNNKTYINYVSYISFLYFTLIYIWLVFGHYAVFWQHYDFIK
jgi:hypothetical protein